MLLFLDLGFNIYIYIYIILHYEVLVSYIILHYEVLVSFGYVIYISLGHMLAYDYEGTDSPSNRESNYGS